MSCAACHSSPCSCEFLWKPEAKVCLRCGVPSDVAFCSDSCEQLAEWERPGSTDITAFARLALDTAGLVAGIALSLSLLFL